MVWHLRSHGERLSKENRVLAKQPNKWTVWHGTTQAKASPARTRAKASLERAKAKTRKQDKTYDKKGKTCFDEMEGHADTQETQTGMTRDSKVNKMTETQKLARQLKQLG